MTTKTYPRSEFRLASRRQMDYVGDLARRHNYPSWSAAAKAVLGTDVFLRPGWLSQYEAGKVIDTLRRTRR